MYTCMSFSDRGFFARSLVLYRCDIIRIHRVQAEHAYLYRDIDISERVHEREAFHRREVAHPHTSSILFSQLHRLGHV